MERINALRALDVMTDGHDGCSAVCREFVANQSCSLWLTIDATAEEMAYKASWDNNPAEIDLEAVDKALRRGLFSFDSLRRCQNAVDLIGRLAFVAQWMTGVEECEEHVACCLAAYAVDRCIKDNPDQAAARDVDIDGLVDLARSWASCCPDGYLDEFYDLAAGAGLLG